MGERFASEIRVGAHLEEAEPALMVAALLLPLGNLGGEGLCPDPSRGTR